MAVAKVKFPETGNYRLWVRTRDWVASWKRPDTPETKRAHGTPGIFEVHVNGKAVGTFGDEGEEWHWQDGGTIEVSKLESEIALHDLTGFAGRCAGIVLTENTAMVPPDGGRELAAFRRKWRGYPDKPQEAGKYGFVVVGGGVAGMCAPAEVYIAVHDRGEFVLPKGWRKTAWKTNWSKGITDTVCVKKFEAGTVEVPGHSGTEGGNYGLPHAAFVPAGIAVSKSSVSCQG
jgi:hypothetical protein